MVDDCKVKGTLGGTNYEKSFKKLAEKYEELYVQFK